MDFVSYVNPLPTPLTDNRKLDRIPKNSPQSIPIHSLTRISLPIGTNGKLLAAIGKFPNAIGKLMIGKTLATNGEEITNAMIGNDVLAIYW